MPVYDKQKMIRAGYDLDFISKVQPAGNFKEHPSYIQIGGTFITFIDVYKFPKTDLSLFWLSGIINSSDINAISFLSVGTENSQKIRSQFNQSVNEMNSRLQDPTMSAATQFEANQSGVDLYDMYKNISNGSETMKKIRLKLMVYAPSIDELHQQVQMLKETHFGFSMTNFVDEQGFDYQSMFMPESEQEYQPNKRRSHLVESYDLGAGYPFDYTNLNDDAGTYFGYTNTMGEFVFNPYYTHNNRTHSFSLVAGSTGVGKSTFLKMLNDDAFKRGQYICNFDVTGEHISNTLEQGGIVIDTSDDGNKVNMFEIFPTVADHSGNNIDVIGSFNQNISKIKTIAHIMDRSLDHADLSILDNEIVQFYIDRAMWFNNPKDHIDEINILSLPHNQYPRLEEFLMFLKNELSTTNDTYITKSLNKLIITFGNMEKRYPDIFDCYTSDTMDDLSNQKVIDFDMSKVKSQSSGLDAQVFQALFFSYLSLVSSQVVTNGKAFRNKIANGETTDDHLGMNIDYYYINIDEAQNYFNPDFPDVVNVLANMMEEMRKNYCAITFTFPSLQDILLDDDKKFSENDRAYSKAVNKIFGLFQYYHFFRLTSKDVDKLKQEFNKSSSVSTEQLDIVNNLDKYELITIINGGSSYQWKTDLSKEQIARYTNKSY
ncbi:hypothetical protein DY052_07585 [Apilactobacillus timberlakei]|uniref:helicase HerA domain-containing protein n=1 Tax=Apilactobacillus timberlakei TaxID=2008380 RepID=UPI0011265642|nr:DUF87 domain-containing protein [Apilactobacillus timberlakei]TPR13715.1 hypothetical protein DY052_07585 [Apilactobacillus timberlakei]